MRPLRLNYRSYDSDIVDSPVMILLLAFSFEVRSRPFGDHMDNPSDVWIGGVIFLF
jgi:hypothetical protein